MLDRQIDPDGLLMYAGEVQSGNPDQIRKLLAALAVSLNLKSTP